MSKSDDSSNERYPCPWDGCERDDFASEKGMMFHHARTHGESLAWVEVECEWCGKPQSVERHRLERSENFFCGDDGCQFKWRSENNTVAGEDNPAWKGGKVDVECAWCGNPQKVTPARIDRSDRFFCGYGSDCRSEWMSENLTGEDNPSWSRVEVECAYCGDCKMTYASWAKKYDRFFCGGDSSCRYDWLAENHSGENSTHWKGGRFPYGPGWNEAKKEQVRERDNRECQCCGRSEEDHIEHRGQKHHVHHIQKARTFDDPEVRNHPDNLITLCHDKECHAKWERMSPLRPQTD